MTRVQLARAAASGPSLLFVDDHPLYRDGLVHALGAAMGDLRIVTAADLAGAAAVLDRDPDLDLCLSDQRLPDGFGSDFVGFVRRRHPGVAAGVLSADVTPDLGRAVRAHGGVACLSKDRDVGAIAAALRAIFAGGEAFEAGATAPPRVLTERRRHIVRLAAEGWGDKQICSHLSITESGVRGHWHHIFGRLGATNRTEAVTKALRLRLI